MNTTPLAAIDVGTNSLHMVVARQIEAGAPEILAREKTPVRLGSGASDMKHLDPGAIDRTISALHDFRRIADAHNADVVAIATSAVREAEDRDAFIRRARREAGVDVEIVSGVEEARLIHLGALSGVPIADRQHLVVDIGGGSTEFIVGVGTAPLLARSLKLGHIRLTDRFFPDGVIGEGAVKQCRRYIRSFVAPVAVEISRLGFETAVGCSGTITTIASMIASSDGDVVRTVDNAVITRADLDDLVADLVRRKRPADRKSLPGLEPHRRDVIVAGAVLLGQLFKILGIDEMTVSPNALREGLLLDRFVRQGVTTDRGLHHLSDLRRSSVVAVARRYDEDLAHADHATDLALELFDELMEEHGYGSMERDVLEAAGVLHNIGRFVAHAAHHKHSYYLIRHTEHLAGFTDHETELIAQVARYHRKSAPSDKHPEFAALDTDDQARVRLLAGVLRVGIALDRTYRRVVEEVRVESEGSRVRVAVVTGHGTDVELELFTARERAGLLAEALGMDVDFRVLRESHRGARAHPSGSRA
jgi:exopolyphosphatase/guanosine-5'-triphosphate,3'-diphosphate pyrophosphatase